MSGYGPRSLVVADNTAYIAEYFTGSVGVVNLDSAKSESISLGVQTSPVGDTRRGERLYNDATICFQQWLSCSSCHPDGRPDSLNWDELNDGFGNAKQTKSHLYSHQTPPTLITGKRPNAETSVQAGLRFAYFQIREEADGIAIDEYLKSLTPVPSPYLENGQLSDSALRGKLIFEGSVGCSTCHLGNYYTDMQLYDVGTGSGREAATKFDTPTLVEIWRTAPYLYDGRAATIMDVLTTCNIGDTHGVTSTLTSQQLHDLAEYVLSIGD